MPSAMYILFKARKLKAGDEIEPVPEILPADVQSRLAELRAAIVDPENQRYSIRWNGKEQSIAKMRKFLERKYHADTRWGEHRNFRLVGHEI